MPTTKLQVNDVSRMRLGFFDAIGDAINGIGHAVRGTSNLAIAGHQFTDGLPNLALQSSTLMQAKAQEALDEQMEFRAKRLQEQGVLPVIDDNKKNKT